MSTLSDFLSQSASYHPEKPALIYKGQTWSYSELYEKSRRLAASFQQMGIQKNDRAALILKNSPEFVLSVFALSHIGAVAVPINFMQKPDEMIYICKHSAVKALLTQHAFVKTAQEKARTIKFDPATVVVKTK